MKKTEAIETAVKIASLVKMGVARLGRTNIGDLPLLAWLPILKLSEDSKKGKEIDFDSLGPQVAEIIIFGSVARGTEEEVGDIDMIILANGFFSDFFSCQHENDWYCDLAENLYLLLSGWLDYSDGEIADLVGKVDTDVHVLPLAMLQSKNLRSEIAQKHSDPHFLQNAFSTMLRFNGQAFVPADIAYLETKYGADLSDLRK